MKHLHLITAFSILALALVSCSKQATFPQAKQGKLIITSFYPIYVSTIHVTRDVPNVKVVNMTQPFTGCLHDYQLTPDNLKQLSSADIFIANGLGMEQFIDKVVKQVPSLKIVEASKDFPAIHEEHDATAEKHEHGDKKDETHDEDVNPHVWVSISGAIVQVKNIADELSRLDAQHADLYRKNADQYVGKLEQLRTKMHETLSGAKKRDIIVFHEAFPYFAREFNLNIVGVIEREPGSEPSAKEIVETVALIRKTGVKAIFVEPQYPNNSAQAISRETGVKILTLDPCVTGTLDLPAAYDTYTTAMESNLAALKEALLH